MSDVGQSVLGVVGAGVGAIFGLPLQGWVVGSTIGGLLFPPEQQTQRFDGPRLSDLKVQISTYGRVLPIAYGTVRIAGNVIWSSDLIQVTTVTSQEVGEGKASQEVQTTNYSYFINMAVSLCEGEINAVQRIWANNQLIYDLSASANYETYVASKGAARSVRVYKGTETQLPDSLITAAHGAANTPAFRGTSYVVFERLALAKFGNRPPNLEFEVLRNASLGTSIGYIDAQSTLGQKCAGSIARNSGNIIAVYQDLANNYHLAYLNPYTGAPIQELPVTPYMGSNKPFSFFAPAANKFGDIVYWDDGQNLWILPSGGVPSGPFGIAQWTNIVQDGNGYFYTSMLWGSSDYRLLRIAPGATAPTTLLMLTTSQSATCLFKGSGVNLYMGTVSGGTYRIYEIDVNGGGITRTYVPSFPPSSLAVAGDGSTWYTRDNSLYRVNPAWSSEVNIITGSPHTGSTQVRIARDWATGDIIFADLGVFRRYAADGTLIHSLSGIDSFLAVSDSVYTDRLYVMNNVQPFGFPAVNRLIGAERLNDITEGSQTVASVVTDICGKVGLDASMIDVTALTQPIKGFVVATRMPARSALSPLASAYFFDAVESDTKLKFVLRSGASAMTIPESDMGAELGEPSENPSTLEESRTQEPELPREISINFSDKTSDYQQNAQYARRITPTSENDISMDLPLVLDVDQARQMAETLLHESWANRSQKRFSVSRKYAKLEPTDIVTIDLDSGDTITARIVKEERDVNRIVFDAVEHYQGVYTQAVGGVEAPASTATVGVPVQSELFLIDNALLDDLTDSYGFYAAAGGPTSSWPGAKLFKSADLSTYGDTGLGWLNGGSRVGFAATSLASFGGGNVFDDVHSVEVQLLDGALSSTTEQNVLAGNNWAVLGSEVIGFQTATLIGTNKYRLQKILRARRSTEWAMGLHFAGEGFAVLDTASIISVDQTSADLGITRGYKAVTFGASLDAAVPKTIAMTSARIKPASPSQLGGGRNTAGDVIIKWNRRARLNFAWVDGMDVPLEEPTEAYEIETYAGSTVSITAVTRAADAVFTTSGAHGLAVGNRILITGAGGMGQINNRTYTVTALPSAAPTTTFQVGLNTVAYTAYTSGGVFRKHPTGRGPLTASTPTVTYTGTQQTTDYLGLQNPVFVAVFQISSRIGRGFEAVGSI